jgi:protein involved in polysaccharide export with SLBB domain
MGAVRSPSVFDLKEGDTLADVLVAGGNPTPRADLRHVTIMHTSGATTVVDLISKEGPAAAEPNAPAEKVWRLGRNVLLQAGDVILVPEGPQPTALVLGEVNKPGPYEIQGEARLLDLLAQAGGPTPTADLRRISLRHAGAPETQTLDLQPLLVQGDTSNTALNVPILPGDTIVLAATDQVVYVVGRVAKPGIYPLKPNQRVLDVLLDTGGAGEGATKATLVRRGPDGHPVPHTLDLKKIMAQGDVTENEVMRPGDMLYVPDKKNPRSAQDLFYPFITLFTLLHL